MKPAINSRVQNGDGPESPALRSSLQRFVDRSFRVVVCIWPTESREWALAMQAELLEIESTREGLKWLGGGIMSLVTAWWNRAVYGVNLKEIGEVPPKMPGLISCALTVFALAAFFLVPSVHEGVAAVIGSWRPLSISHLEEFQRMSRQAEADHDAVTLAFLSSRMGSVWENARLANEAVAIDPSFAWIYLRGSNSWYVYNHIPEKHGWIQKLEASDPDNGATYLTEAGIRESEIQMQFNYQAQKEKILNDPVWRAAMEKAFAAPRYDYYYDRAIALQQSVLKAHNLVQPQEVARGLFEYYSPGLFVAQKYSNFLLGEAKEAKKKGDTRAAIQLAWTVAQFAERARLNTHSDVSRATIEAMLQSACVILQPLEATAGHSELAKLLEVENEAITLKMAEKNPIRMPYIYQPLDATSIAVQFSGIGVIVLGWSLLFSAVFLLAARFATGMRGSRFYRWSCNCGRYAPAALIAGMVLMAATFAPYLENVQNFFSGVKDTTTLNALIAMNDSLFKVPSRIFSPMNFNMHAAYLFYLWTGILFVSVISGALFLGRSAFRAPEARVKGA